MIRLSGLAFLAFCGFLATCLGQISSGHPDQSLPAERISLQDALTRARKYGNQLQAAEAAVSLAREDRKQATAARLPSLNAFNQFIYTEGNGTPSGVFVANDGVHVYNEQAVVHEELLSLARRGEVHRAQAAEAAAQARRDLAVRGLNATVIQYYYALVSGQRKHKNAETSLADARQFLDITQKQEQGGEAAHADVVKAQIQVEQRQRDLQDAALAEQKAQYALSVLIFPSASANYFVVDDLDSTANLGAFTEIQAEAQVHPPDVEAAQASLRASKSDVTVARYGYLPSLSADFFYGINANQFAARTSYPTQATGRSVLPNYLVPFRQNLGYSAQVTLNIPVWNWGATQSKVRQAQYRRDQAEQDLSLTRKQFDANVSSFYAEAKVAQAQISTLKDSLDLASESLRLTVLRYKAGEATTLEVVDAQSTAALARNAYADGLVRYKLALANIGLLTGRF